MMKTVATFFCLFLFSMGFCAQDTKEITGFWTITDQKTGASQCIVAVYEYDDKYYGRIVATYNKKGEIDDTIYAPKSRAPGVVGEPFYCGLDFIFNLEKRTSRYKGKIMDPEKGNVYNSEVWADDDNLIVRGELFIFGRNQTWPPTPESAFTKNFKKPDPSTFVPIVHETK